jgi:hypothetical protein
MGSLYESIDSLKEAQTDNIREGNAIEELSVKFLEDNEEIERLRATIEASDIPAAEKNEALAWIDEQLRALEAAYEKDVEEREKKRHEVMEQIIQEAEKYRESAEKNQALADGFKERSGMDASSIRQLGKEQAEVGARAREASQVSLEFNKAQNELIANHTRRIHG